MRIAQFFKLIWQREAATSQGLWKQVKAKQKQLECDSEVHRRTFEVLNHMND